MRYTVTADRGSDPRVWVLQCVEVPGAISETRRLSEARELMVEAIAFAADIDEREVEIDLRPILPDGLGERVREAQGANRQLQSAQRATASRMRAAIAALDQQGLTGADMAVILDVSPQRVSQLRHEAARLVS